MREELEKLMAERGIYPVLQPIVLGVSTTPTPIISVCLEWMVGSGFMARTRRPLRPLHRGRAAPRPAIERRLCCSCWNI
jgi:hypothetical protein